MDVVSDAIASARIGRPDAHRVEVSGTWCCRLPAYEGVGFHVVLEGGCWLLPDGGGAPLTLAAGDAVLLPRGAGHVLADSPADARAVAQAIPFERWRRETADGTTRPPATHPEQGARSTELLCGKYRFDRTHAHPLFAELPETVHLPRRAGHHPELQAAIGLLGRETGASLPGADVAVPGLLDLLLVYLVRAWATDRAAGPGWPAALADPVVAEALRLLHAAPEAPWTNASLAARTGVSRATLTRRFTALVGRAPMTYLTWWRMSRAATLLRETTHPLETVARQVGYSSPYALSHAFTRTFGVTPGRYRKAPGAHRTAAGATLEGRGFSVPLSS
ncbi:helix-turn-helix domain-containing protein [Streptomyces sp. BG9H]|uniref:Helix-turn-helix domain-containing protein n=1 Tax=Streptomyces anatolicus TaxID=2675858 RepID=A0ABS6YLQ4_9ACTN|nr:AraC family transcriptional regulator [Streptomyces anatolicus]MBW5422338.1 helix-turn-helix domain-containing protein [Streptomyces anatolicus]